MTAVRLVAVRPDPLSVDEVLAAVRDDRAGGTALFLGHVRDSDAGRQVSELLYSAHPTAAVEMQAVADLVAGDYPAIALAAVHRVGALAIGDIAVIVAVACAHRGDAFQAGRRLIDEIKATVPIWKHQVFTDGTEEWVGSP